MPGPPEPPPANDRRAANQVLVGTVDLADERSRHLVLPGADHNRFGADGATATAVGAARRSGLVREQPDTFAVNGDVDVLELREQIRRELHLEHVFGVGREHVIDDDAAARAERCAVDVIPGMLRDVAGVGVVESTEAALQSPTAIQLIAAAAFR